MSRHAKIERITKETQIRVSIQLDGRGESQVSTGIGFFDHLLTTFCRHALIDLDLQAEGDLQVDGHHTVEDTGIIIGQALDRALGDRAGIVRFGHAYCPLDESLARSVVDICGRGFLAFHTPVVLKKVGEFDGELLPEFFRALAFHGKMTLHCDVLRGENQHHLQEALVKSFGRALRVAVSLDDREQGIASTKGILV